MARTGVRLSFLLLAALIVVGVAPSLSAQSSSFRTTETFLALAGITQAGRPVVLDELVVFTFEQPRYARYVAVAFGHEQYRELHILQARRRAEQNDLYYLAFPYPRGVTTLEYRFVVDGVWIADPNAPEVRRDAAGVAIGIVRLPPEEPHRWSSPQIHGDGTATFYFSFDIRLTATLETASGDHIGSRSFVRPEIALVGSFNGWDPFGHQLQPLPEHPEVYSVRVPVPRGVHQYYFLIDGVRILDPYNLQRAVDRRNGFRVSTVRVD